MTEERKISGVMPGVEYQIRGDEETTCLVCGRSSLPLLVPMRHMPDIPLEPFKNEGVCEFCSHAAVLAFRQAGKEELPGTRALTAEDASSALVLIVRPTQGTTPDDDRFEVLMVGRKDEPEAFGLPGGKKEKGESPEDTAVRELSEETGVKTWRSALEPLYIGLSARGRLVRTYLARGYSGIHEQREAGVPVAWKPWPPGQHSRYLSGYYVGLAEAFDLKLHAHRRESTASFPCVRVRNHIADQLKIALGEVVEEDRAAVIKAMNMITNEDERVIIDMVLQAERRKKESALSAEQRARRAAARPTAVPRGPEGGQLDLPAEVENEIEGEGDVEEAEAELEEPEFVRGPPPRMPSIPSRSK